MLVRNAVPSWKGIADTLETLKHIEVSRSIRPFPVFDPPLSWVKKLQAKQVNTWLGLDRKVASRLSRRGSPKRPLWGGVEKGMS